jgi:MFS family permease
MSSEKKSTERDPAYGWLMVFVVFTLSGLSFGALGAISVFLKPLSAEFGWGRAETSLGYTAIAFSSALFGILWGFVADKYGSRWFGVVAAITMSLCLFMLSAQTNIFQFYAFYFLFGAFGNAMARRPYLLMWVSGFAIIPVSLWVSPRLVERSGRVLCPILPV